MNKKFYFALALTAGLFASCSSDEVALAPQMNVDDSQKAPIELKLGSLSSVTRGTGTVGSLAGAGDNVWAGQKFNVYMFDKGTLTLALDELGNPVYENQEFASPNILAGLDANTSAKVVAAAGTDIDGTNTVQDPNPDGLTLTEVNGYFPQSGNFDFWAYRLDGAATGAPALNATSDAMVVPFTITGSEDIMVAKAAPTTTEEATKQPADASHAEPYYHLGATAADDVLESQVYSAYAARRGMHPHLNFQHLLSRLTFNVKSTEGLSQQYADPTDEATKGAANPSAVRVTEIKVNAVASGELAVAYTTAPAEIITFTAGSEADLFLQQRAREVETLAKLAWSQDLTTLGLVGEDAVYDFAASPDVNEPTTNALEVYQSKTDLGADGLPNPTTNPASTLGAAIAAGWTHIYAYKVETPTTYGKPDVAADLVALAPVTPRWNSTTDAAYQTPVGESLLLAPAATYQIFITMEQDVPELTQVISWKDEQSGTIYYFDTEADRDALVALYNAWKAAGYGAGAEKDAYDAVAATTSTAKIEKVLKSTTKTTVTPLTLNGPKTVSLGVTTYKEFEANKSYNINITLNGMESVSSDTEITGYDDGGDVDIEN